jgi:hypothetical protein
LGTTCQDQEACSPSTRIATLHIFLCTSVHIFLNEDCHVAKGALTDESLTDP